MAEIEVSCTCPICKKEAILKIPEDAISKSKGRLFAVHVDEGICCEHQFLTFINTKTLKVIGYQKIDVETSAPTSEPGQSIDSISSIIEDYGLDTVQKILHAMLLKIPILVMHDRSETTNRANLLNNFFFPMLPKASYKNYLPFFRTYDSTGFENMGLLINLEKKLEDTGWAEVSLVFEDYLINKALEFMDAESQQLIIQSELEKLESILNWIKKQIKLWGGTGEPEIKEKIDALDANIPKDEFLMEILQYLQFSDFDQWDLILIDRRNNKVKNFYHEIIKDKERGFKKFDYYLRKEESIGEKRIEVDKTGGSSEKEQRTDTLNFLLAEYGRDTIQKILHAMLLKIPIFIYQDPYEEINRANLFNEMFLPILAETRFQDYPPFFHTTEATGQENLGLLINAEKKMEKIGWAEVPLVFEDYLINKALENPEKSTQQSLIHSELEKMDSILAWIEKQIKLWGGTGGPEIREKFEVFEINIPQDELLMEVLQYLQFSGFNSWDLVLVGKRSNKVKSFYHEILKDKERGFEKFDYYTTQKQ